MESYKPNVVRKLLSYFLDIYKLLFLNLHLFVKRDIKIGASYTLD